MKTKLFFIVFTFASLFYSCSSDDGGNSTEENITIIVKVVDENNQPISNARITNGSDEITTNSSGIATINNPTETYGKYRFGISKDNHFPGSLKVDPYNVNSEGYTIMLLAASSTETIPNTGGTISGYDWTFTSTGGFVYENGSPVSGNVDIAIRYINPDNLEEIQAAFPGGDFGGVGGGVDLQLYVYGFVAISYTQNGIRVYPAVGSVTITVQVPGVYANAAQNGGKVFYYDEAAQIWEESANPTVSGLNVTMPLPSQTTFCCFGKGYPIAKIKYKATNCDKEDGFIYFSVIEWNPSALPNIIGVTYTSFVLGGTSNLPYFTTHQQSFNGYHYPNYESGHNVYNTQYDNSDERVFSLLANFDYGIKLHSLRLPKWTNINNGGVPISELSDMIIEEYSSFSPGVTVLGDINKFCTNQISNPHTPEGRGWLYHNNTGFTGKATTSITTNCQSGISVLVQKDPNTVDNSFRINNIPEASFGNFNFIETTNSSSSCGLTFSCIIDGVNYVSDNIGGSLRKLSENRFSFHCSVKQVFNEQNRREFSGEVIYINDENGNNGNNSQGQFTYNGTSYSGDCVSISATQCSSGGKDVTILSNIGSFIIYNMPQASSGTYNFTEFQSGGCNLFVISTVDGNATSTGGTLTKTGSNSFTFSCTLQDISNGYVFTITGSGNYN